MKIDSDKSWDSDNWFCEAEGEKMRGFSSKYFCPSTTQQVNKIIKWQTALFAKYIHDFEKCKRTFLFCRAVHWYTIVALPKASISILNAIGYFIL